MDELNPTTFLLVEDDRNDVDLITIEFGHAPANIRLRVVHDGHDAIEYLKGGGNFANRNEYPLPDVILLDLKMPRVSGFEFLEWLRSQAPEHLRVIPVVVMSSSFLKEDIDCAYELGANSYLVKPVNWEHFKERIRAFGIYWAWHSETPESPHMGDRRP